MELDARMLFLIFILESIKQFFITIEFWISQSDNLELSPTLTFGPKITLGPIMQLLPIMHGPKIFEQSTCHHKPAIHSGILRKESEKLLKNFFIKLRKK